MDIDAMARGLLSVSSALKLKSYSAPPPVSDGVGDLEQRDVVLLGSPALKSHGAARICIRGELAIAVTADTGLYCRGEFIGSKRFLHCNIAADSNNIASHE